MEDGKVIVKKIVIKEEDILENIKSSRNNLAHGAVSFVDAVREDGISDIKRNEQFVVGFLEELIDVVVLYIAEQKYKMA